MQEAEAPSRRAYKDNAALGHPLGSRVTPSWPLVSLVWLLASLPYASTKAM